MSSTPAALATSTTSSALKRELAQRQLARRKVVHFAAYVDPQQAHNYKARHLQLIADYLERAEAGSLWDEVPGDGQRVLVIEAPPRHWKSSIINKFVAWFIGKRKAAGLPHQVILTSYGADLAITNSRTVLETIQTPRYANIWPGVQISATRSSAANFGLEGESHTTCVASGVGGPLTGQGGDAIICDDPIKGPEDAYSEAKRQALWDWWITVLRTRLNPGAFVIFLLTRWHEDDVVGRILKQAAGQPNGDRIVVLRLPALAETDEQRHEVAELGLPVDEADPLQRQPGQALWPERYSAAELQATRALDEVAFDAMYQGRPGRQGGYLLGRQNFRHLEVPPEGGHVRWVICTDWAITERQVAGKKSTNPDYTVAALLGIWMPEGMQQPRDAHLVLAAVERTQSRAADARRFVKAFALEVEGRLQQRPAIVAGQDNIDSVALDELAGDPQLLAWPIQNIARRMLKGDKVVRSHAWRSRALNGRFFVVSDAWWRQRWHKAFFLEVEGFPRGAKDDQVDAISVGAHYLAYGATTKKASSYQG